MKLGSILAIAIAAIVATPACIAAVDDNKQPFTIVISARQETVKVGEEARVHVVLTNTSKQELFLRVSVGNTTAEQHYTVIAVEKSGKEVPETEYGRHARLRQLIGSDSATLLKPGEKREEDIVLTSVFDLSSPGEYEIQISRPASEEPDEMKIIKSNKITILVKK